MSNKDEVLEIAIWFNAAKIFDPLERFGETIKEALAVTSKQRNAVHGDITHDILKPSDDRVPPVPNWLENIKGCVPRLLIVYTPIKNKSSVTKTIPDLVADLDKKDLGRLRAIVRHAHQKAQPNTTLLSNIECDEIINKCGMETVMEELKNSVVH